MATTQIQPPSTKADGSPVDIGLVDQAGRTPPVKWYAAFGTSIVLLSVYLFGRWILSGPTRTPIGADKVPDWMLAAIRIQEIVNPLLALALVYLFIVRPWRRERRVTLNGLMIVGLASVYWQDLIANYFNHVYTENAALINWGSWFDLIPGWTSPRAGHLVEGVFFGLPGYVAFCLPPCLLLAQFMRRVKSRFPQVRNPGLLLAAFLLAAPLMALIESMWLRTGVYVYAGTIPSLTFFRGHYYQYPLYELFMFGLLVLAWTSILYFRDDKGNTFAERRIDDLHVTPRQKTVVRGLALIAAVNIPLLIFNIVTMGISLLPSFKWGDDIVNRSYFRNELCGPGTTYHCPDRGIPIPRRGDAHVDPDGRLVAE